MADLDPVLVAELDRIAPAKPMPERRWAEFGPRRRSPRIVAVAVAAAAIAALAVPWQRGPASLSSADAARVIRRTVAALSAAHGPVLHLRLRVAVSSPDRPRAVAWSGTTDEWIDETGPQNYRVRTTFPNLPAPLEIGGTYRAGTPTYVYDSATRTLYYVPIYGPSTGYVDPITRAKGLRPGPGVTVRRVGSTYRIDDERDIRRPDVLVVDAKTYRPIRESWTLGGSSSREGSVPFALFSQKPHAPLSALWQTVQEYVTYEYVDGHALASIRAQFPHAKVGVAPDMPRAFKRAFAPWTGP